MKLKPIKWRKGRADDGSGGWEEARAGVFAFSVDEGVWDVDVHADVSVCVHTGRCRSVEDGKRKAGAWLRKQINRIVEE